MDKPIAETSYKAFALLYGLLCFLCLVASFFGVVLFITGCLYAYGKYYKQGFIEIAWSILEFITNGYHTDSKALLWVVIISSTIMAITLLLLSEQGKGFINTYFDSLQQQKEKKSLEEESDEIIEDDPNKELLLLQKEGWGFLYKLYEMGNMIYVFVIFVVIEVIFVSL
jgi:hypothetical protein